MIAPTKDFTLHILEKLAFNDLMKIQVGHPMISSVPESSEDAFDSLQIILVVVFPTKGF
jgi:hypothetical protein